MIFLLLLVVSCVHINARYVQQSGEWTSLVPRKTAKVDHQRMLNAQSSNRYENSFTHSKDLISATKSGKSFFRVNEIVDTTAEKDPSSYKDVISAELYNLTAAYTLFKNHRYHSLDSQRSILDISSDYIDICDELSVGDYLIASDAAIWLKTEPEWSRSMLSERGLVLTRIVTDIAPLNNAHCRRAKTKNVTPFQLFEFIRVDTTSKLPFTHFYNTKDANERIFKKPNQAETFVGRGDKTKQRGLFSGAGPDAPVVACTDSSVIAVDDQAYVQERQGNDDDLIIISGYTDGCVSILNNFLSEIGSSFNFNYDVSSNSAASSFNLVSGITCSNCYAYLGVYIYAVFEYADVGLEMAFEAKLDGGIGFNIQADLASTSYSGSDTIQLLAAATSGVSIPLGFGLSLTSTFGGLSATVSASASTSGSASTGAGANANAYIGLEYDYEFNSEEQGDFTFPSNAEFSYTAPYFSYSNFEIDSLDVTVSLAATQNFLISYTWLYIDWLGADFALVLSGAAELSYGDSSSSAVESSVTVSAVLSPSTETSFAHVATQSTSLPVIAPGNTIPLIVNVKGFNPSERVVLFFSFIRDDYASSVGVPIAKTEFIVPATGAAAVTIQWLVPWDTRFLQKPTASYLQASRVAVHGSNKMSNTFYSSDFLVLADPSKHCLVTEPTSGDTVVAGSQLTIKWDPKLLSYFKHRPGTGGHGSLKRIRDVILLLVRESFSVSSKSPVVTVFNVTASDHVLNNGSATVTIPETVLEKNLSTSLQRFFIKVKSRKWANLVGWSKGHFSVVPKSHSAPIVSKHLVVAEIPHENEGKVLDNFRLGRRRQYAVRSPVVKRATSSCTASVTITAKIDGTLTDVVVCDIPFSVGLSTGELSIYNSGPICVDSTAVNPIPAPAPAPAPTPAGNPVSSGGAYYYFFAVESTEDDNTANTVSVPVVSSPAPTETPISIITTTSGSASSLQNGGLEDFQVALVVLAALLLIVFAAVTYWWVRRSQQLQSEVLLKASQEVKTPEKVRGGGDGNGDVALECGEAVVEESENPMQKD